MRTSHLGGIFTASLCEQTTLKDCWRLCQMELDSIIEGIYDAAMQPGLWPSVLDEIREFTDAKHAVLSFYDGTESRQHRVITAGATPEQEQTYLSEYIESDMVWLRRLFHAIPEGTAINSTDFETLTGTDRKSLLGSHQQFFDMVGLQNHVFALPIHTTDQISAFSIHRSSPEKTFAPYHTDIVARISSHLRKALRIFLLLESASQSLPFHQSMYGSNSKGFVLIDQDLRIQYANMEASRILQLASGLRVSGNNTLQAQSPDDQKRLGALISKALASQNLPKESIAVGACSRGQPLKLTPVKISQFRHEIGLVIVDTARPLSLPHGYLKLAYGLTSTESEVAQLLVNGRSINQIAATRGTTESTARWQLKCVMEKTRTSSQSDLIRLLISLID